jgi:hypothetical protein
MFTYDNTVLNYDCINERYYMELYFPKPKFPNFLSMETDFFKPYCCY